MGGTSAGIGKDISGVGEGVEVWRARMASLASLDSAVIAAFPTSGGVEFERLPWEPARARSQGVIRFFVKGSC